MTAKTFNCIHCGKAKPYQYGKSHINKFCSPQCKGVYTFEVDTINKFKAGLISERPTLRKCLSHTVGYRCVSCGVSDYNGKPITLQVDHIDGHAGNNNPENLQLMCPNCHSQSEFFSGKNKGNGRKFHGLKLN